MTFLRPQTPKVRFRGEMMTNAEALIDFLRAMNDMMGQFPSSGRFMSAYEYVLTNGRAWDVGGRPSGVRRGTMKYCFDNSQKLARRKGLLYAEGFALGASPIATMHAWCVGEDDLVIDVTPPWSEREDSAYFGVIFDMTYVEEATRGNIHTISVLDNWEKGFPLLTRSTTFLRPPSPEAHLRGETP